MSTKVIFNGSLFSQTSAWGDTFTFVAIPINSCYIGFNFVTIFPRVGHSQKYVSSPLSQQRHRNVLSSMNTIYDVLNEEIKHHLEFKIFKFKKSWKVSLNDFDICLLVRSIFSALCFKTGFLDVWSRQKIAITKIPNVLWKRNSCKQWQVITNSFKAVSSEN